MNSYFAYQCQSGQALDGNVNNRSSAANSIQVKCNTSGELEYPSPWPQCYDRVNCNSPPDAPTNGTRVWVTGTEGDTLYESKVEYTCKPGSKFDTNNDGSGDTQSVQIKCLWKKSWSAAIPTCVVTHCLEPATPLTSLNFNYKWDNQLVPIGNNYIYHCQTNKAFESATANKSEALTSINVKCNSSGDYEYPVTWPQCSTTVNCASLPEALINGTRIWVKGSEGDTLYESKVNYTCKLGSQFDTDANGFGDSLSIINECLWNKQWSPWSILPSCKITHCLEPITPDVSLNYNFAWDNQLVAVGNNVTYICQTNMVFEANKTLKSDSRDRVKVLCKPDGNYAYPSTWSQCSETVSCGTPPAMPVNGTQIWTKGTQPEDIYDTNILYKCKNGSTFDTNNDGVGDTDNVTINCQWRKVWSPWPVLPKCVVTHCIEPFSIPGDTDLEELNTNWVPIQTWKWYQCKGKLQNGTNTKFFESDRTITSFSMLCQSNGTFKFVDLRENWPTCLSTVHCGQPPNVTENGIRSWMNGIEFKETYGTIVSYGCVKGSQFDTNGDELGDSLSIETTCQWNKTWTPWSILPKCFITHCVDPYKIPLITSLEETSLAWTKINTNKEYRCSRINNGVHTQFFQSDRSKSSFVMRCLANGKFDFVNDTGNWPICLEGKYFHMCSLFHFVGFGLFVNIHNKLLVFIPDIECIKLPPAIPNNPEYYLAEDDGKVIINKIIYPSGTSQRLVFRSDRNSTEIARNYMANLT